MGEMNYSLLIDEKIIRTLPRDVSKGTDLFPTKEQLITDALHVSDEDEKS